MYETQQQRHHPRVERTCAVPPGDLITTYNLAQALLELAPDEHRDEADQLLLQVSDAQPYGELRGCGMRP